MQSMQCNWSEMVSEPPITASLTDTELSLIADAPFPVLRWLNNTQPMERGMKVLTEVAGAEAGAEEQDGFIRQRLYSRSQMPRFKIESDFSFS